MNKGDKEYKAQAIKAARELWYGKKVIEKIKAAKTDNEIALIMRTARKEKFG